MGQGPARRSRHQAPAPGSAGVPPASGPVARHMGEACGSPASGPLGLLPDCCNAGGRPAFPGIRHQGISSRAAAGSSSCCRRLRMGQGPTRRSRRLGAGPSRGGERGLFTLTDSQPGIDAHCYSWERGRPARKRAIDLLGARASRPQAGLWPAIWAKRAGVPQAVRSDRYRIVAMRAGRPRSQAPGIREQGEAFLVGHGPACGSSRATR